MAYRSSASTEMCFTSSTISHPFCWNSEHWVLYFSHFWNSTRFKTERKRTENCHRRCRFCLLSLKTHYKLFVLCVEGRCELESTDFDVHEDVHHRARSAAGPDGLLTTPKGIQDA